MDNKDNTENFSDFEENKNNDEKALNNNSSDKDQYKLETNLNNNKKKKTRGRPKKNKTSSDELDSFLSDSSKSLETEIILNTDLEKNNNLRSEFKKKDTTKNLFTLKKDKLKEYFSYLTQRCESIVSVFNNLRKTIKLSIKKEDLTNKIEKENEEKTKIEKENSIKKTILEKHLNSDLLSIEYIKNNILLKGLYFSSIYKNLEENDRPPESYIRSIVQLTSLHPEKELLIKYYISVEHFTREDFNKYSTETNSIKELINLRDQEKLLLPAPTAAQIIEKELRLTLSGNESVQEIYRIIEEERKRIRREEDDFDEFFYDEIDDEIDEKEEEKYKDLGEPETPDEPKNYLSFEFSDFFADLEKKTNESDIPPLEQYGTNLTDLAKAGLLDPCFGRDKELSLLMEILIRRQKNNAILIGEAGVGKTAIIELLASKLVEDDVPFVLMGREIVSLDLTKMVGGSRYRGDFELRIQKVVDAVFENPNTIIFIDEIHNITGAGSAEGSMDAGNILKPILSRSGFQCVGATTIKEYQKIERDAALNRRFQPIKVEEPSIEETVDILYGLRPTIEMYHNIEISPGAFHAAAELSSRHIVDRFLPDKALDLIDRASARLVLRLTSKEYSSVISALINSILRKIGKLKVEAFRKGDIATEFVFQEIENAYRNLLLTWIENDKNIALTRNDIKDKPTESKALNSPLTAGLYNLMQKTILGRVDELLFTSRNEKLIIEKEFKKENLSKEKNFEIYKNIFQKIKNNEEPEYSLYRCSLVLFFEWTFNFLTLDSKSINLKKKIYDSKKSKFDELIGSYFSIGSIKHLQILREISLDQDLQLLNLSNLNDNFSDFILSDAEVYPVQFFDLNELEERRVSIFENFLAKLQPLIQQGLVEANILSGDLDISAKDVNRIYKLLGYFSTSTGKNFLQTFNEPELLKEARKSCNFNSLKNRIGEEDIQKLLCELTGIPIESLTEKATDKLITLEDDLRERVIGQEDAISAISKAVRRSRLGIQNPNRPIASFLFCGPTGVGKTEVTKALASCLFGSEKEMIRLDMSEFMEKFALSRLVGSPPGYVGYDEGGQLTDAVRRRPYSVVLFDELEKAHPDILNILLQILEDGRLTDSQKRLVGFENTVIIMTSNAAASEIQLLLKDFEELQLKKEAETKRKIEESEPTKLKVKDDYVGVINFFESPIKDEYFADIHEQLRKAYKNSFLNVKPLNLYEKYLQNSEKNDKINNKKIENNERENEILQLENNLKTRVLDTLSTLFLPEFLNRLDDIIIFQPLKPQDIRKICDILIKSLIIRVKDRGFELFIDTSVRGKLAKEGYNPQYGARPLRRLITKTIEDLVSETLLNNPDLSPNSIIRIELNEKDKIICNVFSKED